MTPDRSAPALVDAVVSTQWLADHLGSERLVVLDASVIVLGTDSSTASGKTTYLSGYDQYLFDGHIPGAVFGDLVESFSEQGAAYPFTRPSLETFTEAARAAGVSDDCTIVVYDTAYGQFASRLWWLFRSFGHARVAVLDGGFVRWRAEGRPIDDGHVEPIAGSFTAREDTSHWVDKAFVEAVLRGEERAVLVCGVPPREFRGETGGRVRPGHIPGSFNVPAGRLVDRTTNSSVSLAELRERFASALAAASPGTRIVAYCAGGVASAADALALTRLGVADVAVYDGSLAEWSADAEAPLVTGS